MLPAPFREVGHRPWAIPRRPWIMRHTWEDLLFLHWPVAHDAIRRLIPHQVDIDTFGGQAWIALVPFRISCLRLRGLPRIPPSSFVELNVRTYVTRDGKPGVWFLSLDASSRLAVCLARAWYRLPYFPARMSMTVGGDAIRFTAQRRTLDRPPPQFVCTYRANGALPIAEDSKLVRWLTGRYCLYTTDRRGRLYRAEIHHVPWPLQSAEVALETNNMLVPLGLPEVEGQPLAHFSKRLDALVWSPERLN